MEEEDFSSDTSDEDYMPDGNGRLTQSAGLWRTFGSILHNAQ